MRVLALTRYGRTGASSRLRTLQYVGPLAAHGIEVDVSPLFSDQYIKALYGGTPRLRPALAGILRRLITLMRARSYDVIWVEKELIPFFPALLERILTWLAIPWVVDYDDALFHRYDCHSNQWIRHGLGRKIDNVMRLSTLVVAGNDYLASRARSAGSNCVEIIPTVVDLKRYRPSFAAEGECSVIGWIGSPSTQHYIFKLRSVFERLQEKHRIRVVLVGARPEAQMQFGAVPVEVLPWSEETEANKIASFDIGVMPLPDSPWERGKCGYKLIQYMASAKPVVASPVGVNTTIVKDCACGFLATGDDEWFEALDVLLNERKKRVEFGERGRRAVENYYSLQAQSRPLAHIFHRVAGTHLSPSN